MVKILSRAGVSLADIYDVKGSIAGSDQLLAEEIHTIHEMGGTIFAERLGGNVRRGSSTALSQNTSWDVILSGFGPTIGRILGVTVVTLNATRLTNVTLSIRDPSTDREMPIFLWDTNEQFVTGRFQDNGGAIDNYDFLENSINVATLPSILLGTAQPEPLQEMAFRGLTSGFGAGSVETIALMYIAFAQIEGISSFGLPIPGW